MGYATLIVERTGPIATITLNRPGARNALDMTMRQEMLAALDEVDADASSRVLVVTGAGEHFCAGGDVKSMRERRQTAAEGRHRVQLLNTMVLRLVDFPRPTIAMVDGYAVGAGTNLALCCDLVVASERAKFGELFCKIGLAVDGDRKSTRLNSSHGYISYAVFCLKKKKETIKNMHTIVVNNRE